jgi:mannan endo-1,4-beta-mannosidase
LRPPIVHTYSIAPLIHSLVALALGFVTAQGADLTCDGQPFRFVGANLRVMHGQFWRARYDQVLAAAQHDGLRVGRVWALGEGEADAEPWRKQQDLFRAGPDGWLDDAYRQLDRVLVSARAHQLRLIITLANHWKDYGGVPQYLRWIGLDDLDGRFGLRDRFYSAPSAREQYAAHVLRLLTRTNSIDGTPYASDPTIFAWELMNESQVEGTRGRADRRDWIAWASGLIRTHDPNHMISPGLLGYRFEDERQDWIDTLSLPGVSYCDAHLYPKEGLRMRTPTDVAQLIDDHAQLARYVIKKPLVVGEFGVPTGAARFRGQPPARWFRTLLEQARTDGVAGALAWIYEPRGSADEYGIFVDGAPNPLRRALAGAAVALSGPPAPPNPRLSAAQGARPLVDMHVDVTGRATPIGGWREVAGGRELAILPEAFARGRWQHVGTWEGGALVHAYGARTGFFEYRFAAPPGAGPAGRLELRVRLSSEYPGTTSPPDGGSRVQVTLDGQAAATLLAYPDDGLGRWYRIELPVPQPGAVHTLRFEVAPGPEAHGLCIYGRAGALGGVADAAPTRLRWLNAE